MWCFRYRRLLIPYSEGELGERARRAVERHLSTCRGCAADPEEIRTVSGALRSADLAAAEPAADLWLKVSERIADGATPARKPYRRLPQAASAFAGAVLVAAVGFYAMRADLQPVAPTPDDRQAHVATGAPNREETAAAAPAEFGHSKKPGAAAYHRVPHKPAGAGGKPGSIASAPTTAPASASTPAKPVATPPSAAREVSEPPAAASVPELAFGARSVARTRPSAAPEESPEDRSVPRAYLSENRAGDAPEVYEGAPKQFEAADVPASDGASPQSQAVLQNRTDAVRQQQGRCADAAGKFQEAFRLAPNIANAEALVNAQQKAGALGVGIAQSEARLRSQPNDLSSMLYLLAAYKISGNAAGTAEVARSLAKADPANAAGYYADLGAAQAALGNIEKAVDAYALGLESGNAVTWPGIVGSAARCGVLGMLEARFAEAFDRRPDRRTGTILLELRGALKDTAGAAEVAAKLVRLYPEDPVLWLRLGEAKEQAGDIPGARAAYLKAAASGDPQCAALARERLEAIAPR